MSDEIQPASTDTRPYIVAGVLVVVAIFGGLGSWAALAPLHAAVVAPGVVTVSSNRKTLQHFEGGIVAELLARDGDVVARGELLIRLDDTRARAATAILDTQLDLLRARESRLVAEREGGARLWFPEDLAQRADDANVAEILDGQRNLFEARRSALHGEIEILTRRVEQLQEQVHGLTAQRHSTERQIALLDEELAGRRKLFDRGFTARNHVRVLERERQQLEGTLGEIVADIARAENGMGEAHLRTIQLDKEFREGVVEKLHEVQARIFDVEERRIAALDELARLEIRAPRAGTVVGMTVHTVGGVIGRGDPILDIVPEGDELVVEAHVQPRDIDKVTLGQEAYVRFPAFDMRTTPRLAGTVVSVSADRILDPSGAAYYVVRTRIPESELARLAELRLVPGMPAEVFVDTGTRTMLSYLFKPLGDGLARAFKEG